MTQQDTRLRKSARRLRRLEDKARLAEQNGPAWREALSYRRELYAEFGVKATREALASTNGFTRSP